MTNDISSTVPHYVIPKIPHKIPISMTCSLTANTIGHDKSQSSHSVMTFTYHQT